MSQTEPQKKSSLPPQGNQPQLPSAPKPAAPKRASGSSPLHAGSWALGFLMGALVAGGVSVLALRSLRSPAPVASASTASEQEPDSAGFDVVSEPVEPTGAEPAEPTEPSEVGAPDAPAKPGPASETANASATGTLVIVANVQGANVFLNGKQVGKTPHQAKALPPGRYDLKVEKSGFRPHQESVQVGASRQQVSVQLTPASASLRIESSIAGAAVAIDGETRGTTPMDVDDLAPGRHEIRVSAAGYQTHSETVDLSGGSRTISVDLVSPVAELREAVAVKHKHRFGSCEGVLRASADGLVFESDGKDAFSVKLSDVAELAFDKDKLTLKLRDGKSYTFNERNDNPDVLASFQQKVSEAVENGNQL